MPHYDFAYSSRKRGRTKEDKKKEKRTWSDFKRLQTEGRKMCQSGIEWTDDITRLGQGISITEVMMEIEKTIPEEWKKIKKKKTLPLFLY